MQKEDKDLYIYYYYIEGLLKSIHGRDQVTKSSINIIIFSLAKQQFLKDIIIKFILEIRNLDLQFCIVKYQANLILSLDSAHKQVKFTQLVLQTQAQLQES